MIDEQRKLDEEACKARNCYTSESHRGFHEGLEHCRETEVKELQEKLAIAVEALNHINGDKDCCPKEFTSSLWARKTILHDCEIAKEALKKVGELK